MTPEEKAKELSRKFKGHDYFAIILCEEIIKLLSGWPPPRDRTIQQELDFYTAVLDHLKSMQVL